VGVGDVLRPLRGDDRDGNGDVGDPSASSHPTYPPATPHRSGPNGGHGRRRLLDGPQVSDFTDSSSEPEAPSHIFRASLSHSPGNHGQSSSPGVIYHAMNNDCVQTRIRFLEDGHVDLLSRNHRNTIATRETGAMALVLRVDGWLA